MIFPVTIEQYLQMDRQKNEKYLLSSFLDGARKEAKVPHSGMPFIKKQ